MAEGGAGLTRAAGLAGGLGGEAGLQPAAAFFDAFPWEGAPRPAPESLPAGAFLEGL